MTLFFFLVQVVTGGAAAALLSAELLGSLRERRVHHDARAVRLAGAVDSCLVGQPDGGVGVRASGHASCSCTRTGGPRELTWLTGVLMFFITFGFGFSGYLLPWNELAFFATRVGTDMAAGHARHR